MQQGGKKPNGTKIAGNPGWIYALGQGLCEYKDYKFHLSRPALATGRFEVLLRFKNGTDKPDRDSIIGALRLFGLLGGLGSKTRRGWGSVSLESLSVADIDENLPATQQDYLNVLRKLLSGANNSFPPFSAFSDTTQIRLTHQGSQALPLLEKAGEHLLRFRSNGRRGDDKKGGRLIID
jgi:CRISPR-associated protein Cmr1